MIDRRTLPLSALRAFESAATHLHLGRAGEALGVTHGAISHQIRSLEDKLGVQLFTRGHNRLALTPSGNRLFQSVRDGFDRIIDGTHNLDPNALNGSLVVACTQTIAISWAAKHICEFQKKYPAIQIHIKEIQPRQLTIPRDIDIAICYGLPKTGNERIVKLASPSLSPVYSPALVSDRKQLSNIKDFLSFTFLHDGQVSWNKWFEKFNIPISDVSQNIYFPNTSQALTAARLGYGIALCNAFESQEFIRQGQLVRSGDRSIEEENSYFLLSRDDQQISLKSKIFEDWITKACSSTHT